MRKLKNRLKELGKAGLFHIFGSSILAQIGGLLSSIIVIRGLPKVDYGQYVSANNYYSYFSVFVGMGLANAVLQYCSENVIEGRKNAIYKYSLIAGSIANVVVCFLILIFAYIKFHLGYLQTAFYLCMMSALPFVVYFNSYFQIILRVRLKNKAFAYANISYTIVLLVGNIVLTRRLGILGLIVATYLANGISVVVCTWILNRESFFECLLCKEYVLSKQNKKEISIYALTTAVTNFASTILVLLDVTCLDIVLKDSSVLADYKVASTIPSACVFVPSCLITFFYPQIVGAFSCGKKEGKKFLAKLIKLFAGVNIVVYMFLAFLARLIIGILYGKKYLNVVMIFELLSFNFLIYSFRYLLGNVIAAIKKVKVNLWFAVISGIVNILLNLILIPTFGSVGAALATIFVTSMIALLSCFYIRYYCEC